MLEIKNLTAGYRGREVLHGLSLTVEAGELTSIIGPNGCGKSTLLKAILGLIPRREGEIRADGEDVSAMGRKQVAQKLACLAQGQSIPDMTVEQMVLHGRFPYLNYPRGYTDGDREITRAVMEKLGITHLAAEPLSALSGGMRQTAYIAMALAQQTPYILLDEPTTYLDAAHQIELMKLMQNIAAEGRGVIAVMHDLPLALSFSDRVAVMEQGRVVAVGTPSEIARCGVIGEVFGVDVCEADGEFFWRLEGSARGRGGSAK